MIKQYDIEQDVNHCPQLLIVNEYNVDWTITTSEMGIIEFLSYYLHLSTLDNERAYLIALDLYNRAIGVFLIGLGDYKSSEIYKRHVAIAMLLSGARKVFIAHNHPDGALVLSDDDNLNIISMQVITQIFEIEFLGSYIITRDGYINNNMVEPYYFDEEDDEMED